MQRETFETILGRAAGVEKRGERFVTLDENELSVFVGRPGAALSLQPVLSVALFETHIEIEVKERGIFYTTYDVIHAIAAGPRKEKSGRSGVGF